MREVRWKGFRVNPVVFFGSIISVLVVVLIAAATVVAVGKSSSMPNCSIRSNMLKLFAISSQSSNVAGEFTGIYIYIYISRLA